MSCLLCSSYDVYTMPPVGGHLNPAVTFSLCLLGRERWRKFPMYFLFQTIGAFFGASIIFAMYYGKGFNNYPITFRKLSVSDCDM